MRLFQVAAAALIGCALSISSAHALDRTVEVVNTSTSPLQNLYGMRAEDPKWRFNYLPTSSTLPAKAKKTFNFDDGVTGPGSCMRDVVFDFTGATVATGKLTLKNVNICKAKQMFITNCKDPSGHCVKVVDN